MRRYRVEGAIVRLARKPSSVLSSATPFLSLTLSETESFRRAMVIAILALCVPEAGAKDPVRTDFPSRSCLRAAAVWCVAQGMGNSFGQGKRQASADYNLIRLGISWKKM